MMRKLNIGIVLALGAMLVAFGPASPADAAKPHQDPPFTLSAAVCGFPILVQIPVDGSKSTTTTLADGTTVTRIEGAFKETLTNTVTGNTISVNASGPGTVTQAPGSTVLQITSRGLATTFVTNGAQFGLPNFFYYSGPFDFATDTSNDTLVGVSRYPYVKADLCAALS
jgi:hypothetical protein